MNVGDLVWLPERLRTGPFPDLNEALNARPGRIAEVDGDWAMVEYPKWGQFGCKVTELTAADKPPAVIEISPGAWMVVE